jgi:hypothetical protein
MWQTLTPPIVSTTPQAFARHLPLAPLKTLGADHYHHDGGTATIPTPNKIAYRFNDCIGCFRGYTEEYWKFYNYIISKACYNKGGTDFWALACHQQQGSMFVYEGFKICLKGGYIIVRAFNCMSSAHWYGIRTDRDLPQQCMNCDLTFNKARLMFQRSKGGNSSISKHTTIRNLMMKPDLAEQRLHDNAVKLRAIRRKERVVESLTKRVRSKGVNVQGDKARGGIEITFQMVNSYFDEQVKSGKLDPNDSKIVLMKANFNNLQQFASNGFKRSRSTRFDPTLAAFAVQQCMKMGQKSYEPLAEIFGWPSLRRVSPGGFSFICSSSWI